MVSIAIAGLPVGLFLSLNSIFSGSLIFSVYVAFLALKVSPYARVRLVKLSEVHCLVGTDIGNRASFAQASIWHWWPNFHHLLGFCSLIFAKIFVRSGRCEQIWNEMYISVSSGSPFYHILNSGLSGFRYLKTITICCYLWRPRLVWDLSNKCWKMQKKPKSEENSCLNNKPKWKPVRGQKLLKVWNNWQLVFSIESNLHYEDIFSSLCNQHIDSLRNWWHNMTVAIRRASLSISVEIRIIFHAIAFKTLRFTTVLILCDILWNNGNKNMWFMRGP